MWFRYEKDGKDVVQDLNLEVKQGEFYALVGGNGTGKSTTLSLISRVRAPYRGKILLNGIDIRRYTDTQLYRGYLGVLPHESPEHVYQEDSPGGSVFYHRWGKGEEIFRIHCQYEEGRGNRGNRKSDQTGRTA